MSRKYLTYPLNPSGAVYSIQNLYLALMRQAGALGEETLARWRALETVLETLSIGAATYRDTPVSRLEQPLKDALAAEGVLADESLRLRVYLPLPVEVRDGRPAVVQPFSVRIDPYAAVYFFEGGSDPALVLAAVFGPPYQTGDGYRRIVDALQSLELPEEIGEHVRSFSKHAGEA
ncbi:MAG: hypothetical protein NXI21_18725 [Alphaproteobacteria bacterium]|nr:hypothetical protein [Alphaproteobacteria bacterium]